MAIAITRSEYTGVDLRREASRLKDAAQARRCLAVAAVLDGQSRTAAATATGMDRQTLCDWVHRYNAEGIGGLVDRLRPGRPARMSEAQLGELDALVETGPDVAVDGVVRWRRRLYNSYEAIVNACCDAWTGFANAPDLIQSITTRTWANVS